jgi:hypothetical protein
VRASIGIGLYLSYPVFIAPLWQTIMVMLKAIATGHIVLELLAVPIEDSL